jgi:cytochrome c biogenesis protein CcmG/thiol:disulfide interchange protein DsbE
MVRSVILTYNDILTSKVGRIMAQTSSETKHNPAPGRVPKSTWTLLALLCFLAATAGVLGYRRSHVKPEDPLQGDMDEASGGLSTVLSKTPASQQIPLLLKSIQSPNSGLRYAAVDALGNEHGPQVTAAVEGAFTDSASVVRQRAMEVLPKLDSERGLRRLLAGLNDEDLWIRQAAAGQLFQYDKLHLKNMNRAIPMLVRALTDPDSAVSTTSMNVLRKITGQPWRVMLKTPPTERQAMIARWQSWWAQNRAAMALPAEFDPVAAIRPTRSDPAPDFELTDIDGHPISTASQRGKVTLLNFWGTWCPPCQQEIPDLIKLNRTIHGRKAEIVGIALSESDGAEGLRRWCRAHGIEYRQALSTEGVQNAFGHITEVPVSVLIDAQGRIRYRWEGERDYATFNAAVERLLQE